ncbi:MAG TPA: aminotransferase class III-fold pyridoxal phosphate-dependent enzyme, partial [Nakamurella sp.]|nr:aminotransferase class III-fold pyridoxal phosphate-dependent enzyme [Nakamurella sp.]
MPAATSSARKKAADLMIDVLDRQIGAGNVCRRHRRADPGRGRVRGAGPGFLPAVAAICEARGILLIADEVQCGIAWTGHWFASEHERLQPDLVTTAKGLGGGLPIAALTGRAALMDAFPAGGLGGTFSCNPVACEASLWVFDEIEQHRLLARAVEIGEVMRTALLDLQRRHTVIGDARGRGAMLAIELVTGAGDRTPDA